VAGDAALAELLGLERVPGTVELRPDAVVMDPARMSLMRPGPLSFVRTLMARVIAERWPIRRRDMTLDANGHGIAVYTIRPAGGDTLSAVVYSGERSGSSSDRAYEPNWDILVWLFEGDVTPERIAEAAGENARIVMGSGRAGTDVLSWTRGNRSSRLFRHVVDALAAGRQPDVEELATVGYLIRNVYYQANGMNGTRMFAAYPPDHPLAGAYHVQMLGLYLMRQFSLDLVEHVARAQSPTAVALDPDIGRYIGVGNSTGLGLNLLVWNHPKPVSRWLLQRELALGLLRAARRARPGRAARVVELLHRYADYAAEDLTDYAGTVPPRELLAAELRVAAELAAELASDGTVEGAVPERPWAALLDAVARRCDVEAEEAAITIVMEAHPELAEALVEYSSATEERDVDPGMTVAELRALLRAEYDWAWAWDVDDPGARHWVWYKSVEGEEPRRGVRAEGYVPDGKDIVLSLPFELRELDRALDGHPGGERVGRFAVREPRWRALLARVQSTAGLPYHTVRHDLHHRDVPPLDLSRFALSSLKGLDKVFVMNELWVRGVFLQGAPTVDELDAGADQDWIYPRKPAPR
jgi:hypothetical protein